jgi:hypothetical protein
VPQPQRPDQPAVQPFLSHRREGEAFGGRTSVAQALAGAGMAVGAKAGIKQRFTRNDVRGTLRTDHERSSVGGKGNGGLAQSSHGTSVLASNGGEAGGSVVSEFVLKGMGAGGPAPDDQCLDEA